MYITTIPCTKETHTHPPTHCCWKNIQQWTGHMYHLLPYMDKGALPTMYMCCSCFMLLWFKGKTTTHPPITQWTVHMYHVLPYMDNSALPTMYMCCSCFCGVRYLYSCMLMHTIHTAQVYASISCLHILQKSLVYDYGSSYLLSWHHKEVCIVAHRVLKG